MRYTVGKERTFRVYIYLGYVYIYIYIYIYIYLLNILIQLIIYIPQYFSAA